MDDTLVECPVCSREYNTESIEQHVNVCLFLFSSTSDTPSVKKRKKSSSQRPRKLARHSILNETVNRKSMKTITVEEDANDKRKRENFDQKTSNSLVTAHHSKLTASCNQNTNETLAVEAEAVENKTNKNIDREISLVNTCCSNTAASNNQRIDETTAEKHGAEVKKTYSFDIPLADALRPSLLDDFVGQEQTIGRGSVMHKLLVNASIPNMILWGPPGCGKTTLANVIKQILVQHGKESGKQTRFVKLCATTTNVGEVKEIINKAKSELRLYQRRTILFMDEIHHFNKSQQDIFLQYIENGTITLIGATTENPSFSLNNALLSRCRVLTMEKLSVEDITNILRRAVTYAGGHIMSKNKHETPQTGKWNINDETIQWLAEISDGDARIALNNLQMVITSQPKSKSCIMLNDIRNSVKKSHIVYDKKGEEHYNLISAMIKSIRASDDNAALYWMTRMLMSGEDPMYIARRLVRHASEDIGLADPQALVLAVSTLQGCHQIGMPECDVLLAELTIYLARCPKSMEAYMALNHAKSFITNQPGPMPTVPMHLRNAPTKLMKKLGYGKEYNKRQKDSSGLQYMPEGYDNVNFFKENAQKLKESYK